MELKDKYSEINDRVSGKYFCEKFVYAEYIGEAYKRADIVVARAGAHTCYEVIALKKTTVFVPIPWVSHNEQYKNAIMVRDLGSMNGTFVGGQRVQTAPVMSGELLTVGSVTLRVMYGESIGAAYPVHKGKATGQVETISMEDTAQASNPSNEDDDLDELFGDSDPNHFFRNMN